MDKFESTPSEKKAGLIGLGAMGTPMARNLAKRGLLAAVWNRTATKADALAAELGVSAAGSPAQLAAQVDVVMICVSTDDDVLGVIQDLLLGLKPGSVVIDLSTVSPETAREAGGRVRASGSEFLDAPVTGGVEGAKNGTLAIMAGGIDEALETARPALEAISTRIVHFGDIGMGQSAKAVNQVMCAGINEAVTEALAFGARLGLPMDKLVEILAGGAAGNWFLEKRGLTMAEGRFDPGFKLALHQKDLKICQSIADELGIRLELAEATMADYAQLLKQGHGDEDISALYRLKRPQ